MPLVRGLVFIKIVVTMAADLRLFVVVFGLTVIVFGDIQQPSNGYYYNEPSRVFIEGGPSEHGFQSLQVTGNKTSDEVASKQLSAHCGAELKSRSFRLTSPSFPADYPPDIHCSYIVNSFSPRVCQLEVNFLTFRIDCDGGSLVISGQSMCGSQVGIRKFKFTQPRDVIQFHGGYSGGRGFDLAVRQIECLPSFPLPNCGGVYSSPQFYIQSPNYPNFYRDNTNCVYVVQASSQRICELEFFFEDFNIESSAECSKDRLEIGDRQPVCGRLTGSVRYRDFLGELRIRFVADNVGNDRGFRILVTQIPCGSPNPVYPPLPNPNPTYPTFPPVGPVYPITPIFPPIEPGFPVLPVIPPTFPTPIYPTFPPTPPQCCSMQYGGHHFHLASPDFPHNPHGGVDCVHEIRRLGPQVCRLRLEFRYFWVGDDARGCRGSWLEVNGRRLCGCKSGLVTRVPFEPWEGIKVLRYRNGGGVGANSLQGYVIEITQEECFNGYSRKLDTAQNITVDQNYRRVRSEGNLPGRNQMFSASNQSAQLVFPRSKLSANDSEARIQTDVFLFTSPVDEQNESKLRADKMTLLDKQSTLSNHIGISSKENASKSGTEDQKTADRNDASSPNRPLLSLTPPLYPPVSFTSSLKTFATLSSPNSTRDSDDKVSATLSSFPDAIPSAFIPSSQLSVDLSSLPRPDIASFENEERNWRPSCFAAGFHQWLTLAKQFLWTGQALCPVRPPVRPPTAGCERFDRPRGFVQSPGYPRQYPPNVNWCFSFHRVPGFCTLELTFRDFALENSKHCHKDYLLIGGKRRCGNSLAGTTTRFDMTTINFVKMIFVSDRYVSERGFRGHFRQLPCVQTPQPPSPICSRYFLQPEFELLHNSANGRECVFIVVAINPDITQLQISFIDFDLACGQEYLIIGAERFCGLQTGRSVNVDFLGKEIRMVYSSSGVGNGFHLYAKQVPGLYLNVTPARIVSEKPPSLSSQKDGSSVTKTENR